MPKGIYDRSKAKKSKPRKNKAKKKKLLTKKQLKESQKRAGENASKSKAIRRGGDKTTDTWAGSSEYSDYTMNIGVGIRFHGLWEERFKGGW